MRNAPKSTSLNERSRQPYLVEVVSRMCCSGIKSGKTYQKPRAMNQYSIPCIMANQIIS